MLLFISHTWQVEIWYLEDFKILHSQVLKAKFALCQHIARTMKSFSKRSAFYALDGLVDKIGDIKVTYCSLNNLHEFVKQSELHWVNINSNRPVCVQCSQ